MSGNILEVSGLTAGYGQIEVLHGLDFTVADGEIVVILGANGAGKTTTMRAISGMIGRTGSVRFDGNDISTARPDAVLRAGISQVPQGRGTFTDLSVEDNLRAGAYTVKGSTVGDLDRWFEVFPRLLERRDQRAGSLSGGEQQMLAIARAMMNRPKMLLCDEPSLGLAPIITQNLFKILGELRDEMGMALLVVEQNAGLSLQLADRAYVLETGGIVATGTGDELLADDTIKQAYLGGVG
ncbi:MAG: ABC transporter ATP-binding protein [Ilumatobacter sp.]|uniref:ABC transporter ATP-binding protein n=1 Tax=Ilumatobacter sp. TaxID=1967498 RepID=UPI0032993DD7